nr:hypothetical protein [Ruegeria arenilitoris]
MGAAREMARALLADVVRGGDPVAGAQTLRHSPTVNSLAEQNRPNMRSQRNVPVVFGMIGRCWTDTSAHAWGF